MLLLTIYMNKIDQVNLLIFIFIFDIAKYNCQFEIEVINLFSRWSMETIMRSMLLVVQFYC